MTRLVAPVCNTLRQVLLQYAQRNRLRELDGFVVGIVEIVRIEKAVFGVELNAFAFQFFARLYRRALPIVFLLLESEG